MVYTFHLFVLLIMCSGKTEELECVVVTPQHKKVCVLTESGSLCCSKKAENSTILSLGPAIDLPCHAGPMSPPGMAEPSLESNP